MKRKMHVDLKVGDVLRLGDIEVRLEKKSGQAARIEVRAHEDVRVTKAQKSQTGAQECASQTQESHYGKHSV